MSDKSRIEWTETTWNPITGCTKVSQGCKNCYALRDWARLSANPQTVYYGREFTDVQCHPERLDQPLRWTKPRQIFVNSMSDLFHEAVPFEFIDKVFAVMALAPQHTFQVLTKRPERMREYLNSRDDGGQIIDAGNEFVLIGREDNFASWIEYGQHYTDFKKWPLPNVWLGVSVEDQATADERIPLLLETPAAVRWLSMEPLLGAVDLLEDALVHHRERDFGNGKTCPEKPGIDWIVVGGESGPKARPMHPDWIRSLRDQCQAAGVPFFFKQWGEFMPAELDDCPVGPPARDWVWSDGKTWEPGDGERPGFALSRRVGKKTAGRTLDGRTWDEYPETDD